MNGLLEWIGANATLLQVVVSIVSALVWILYLQVFLMNFLRQRRPEILISRGPGAGLEARCFIANLGLEPLYVSQLLIAVWTEEGRIDAAITDRGEMSDEEQRDPRNATNQGPLKSGDSFDAGSFGELVERACQQKDCRAEAALWFELTVVAIHAGNASFIAARRKFDVVGSDGRRDIQPRKLTTRQIRSPWGRWRLRRQLRRDLDWYRR